MKCYIYKIINKITKEKYVGQTTNFSRRISDHLSKLKQNIHPNPKLQSSWNKYGEDNFEIIKEEFNLTKEELDKKERDEILKENSFIAGFNLTEGGTGGNTRINRILDFDKFCFAYFGNKKHQGLINRTGNYLGVDSSTISALVRDISYDDYRERALLLTNEEQNLIIQRFEQELEINNKPPKPNKQKLSQEKINIFLCIVTNYGRGAEAAITRYLQISKGLKHHIVKGEYKQEYENFLLIPNDEKRKIAIEFFNKNNLQQYCVQTITLNKGYVPII